jgi:hypothetical protein
MIPAEYRSEILELNMIARAQANSQDTTMEYLMQIWGTYIEPGSHLDAACGLCRERILKNYRQLQPVMVELKKQENLLKAL